MLHQESISPTMLRGTYKLLAPRIANNNSCHIIIAMNEADIKIDLTAERGVVEDEQRALTDKERGLRRHFGYKQALVRPSQILGTGSYGNVVKATLDDFPCAAKILHNTFFTSNDPNVQDFTQRCSSWSAESCVS